MCYLSDSSIARIVVNGADALATAHLSRDWIIAFNRRSRVEGWFGNLKSRNTEGLTRGAFRVIGLAKTSLMLGIYAACTNLRLLRAWTAREGSDEVAGSIPPTAGQTERRATRSGRRISRPPD